MRWFNLWKFLVLFLLMGAALMQAATAEIQGNVILDSSIQAEDTSVYQNAPDSNVGDVALLASMNAALDMRTYLFWNWSGMNYNSINYSTFAIFGLTNASQTKANMTLKRCNTSYFDEMVLSYSNLSTFLLDCEVDGIEVVPIDNGYTAFNATRIFREDPDKQLSIFFSYYLDDEITGWYSKEGVFPPYFNISFAYNNTVPALSSIVVSPDNLTIGNDIYAATVPSDADYAQVLLNITVAWVVNGSPVWNQTLSNQAKGTMLNLTLGAANYSRYQEINVTFSVNDSYNVSSVVLDTLLMAGNDAPVVDNVSISPENPYDTNLLNCTYDFSDFDGDAENGSIIEWFLDGENQHITGATIGQPPVMAGDLWACNITPSDGLANGSSVMSPQVSVRALTSSGGGGTLVIVSPESQIGIDFGRAQYSFSVLTAPSYSSRVFPVTNRGQRNLKGSVRMLGNLSAYVAAEICSLEATSCSENQVSIAAGETALLKLSGRFPRGWGPQTEGIVRLRDGFTGEVSDLVVTADRPPLAFFSVAGAELGYVNFSERFGLSERSALFAYLAMLGFVLLAFGGTIA